jgi:hypothetical protein
MTITDAVCLEPSHVFRLHTLDADKGASWAAHADYFGRAERAHAGARVATCVQWADG